MEELHVERSGTIAFVGARHGGGAIAAGTDNLDVNVGITIILVSGALLVAEYIRSYRTP